MQDEILRKLTSLEEATGLAINAFEKSLRAYRTKLHPLLKERLVVLGDTQDDLSDITETSSYQYSNTDEAFTGAQYSNYVFQSFFDHEEPEFGEIIYIKCSKKTTGPQNQGKLTMDKIIERKLRQSRESVEIGTLRDLCFVELGDEQATDLLQEDYKSTTLCKSIENFLRENHYVFPANRYVQVAGRRLPEDLEMDSKFYPTRNDDRAYCKDRNTLRHLTGCCLHRLFLPKSVSTRENLQRNSVVPAHRKDHVDITIPRRPGRLHRLTLSDISNFTGSNGNSWAMLHCMALQLSQGGAWSKMHNVFCVRGAFFRATWKEIITIYLYHVVGVPCKLPGSGGLGFLPGGFLGVAANITIGLVMLSVILENLKRLLRKELDFVHCQAGGDDNFFVLVGIEDDVEESTDMIRRHLKDYVGHIKEFQVIDLEDLEPGLIKGARYCKKELWLERGDTYYRVRSLPSIPIPESLSTGGYVTDIPSQLIAWRSLHLDLARWVDEHPFDVRVYADTIRARFLEIYPNCAPPLHTERIKVIAPYAKWEVIEGIKITKGALDRIGSYRDVATDDQTYLNSFRERVRHALVLGDCREISGQINGLEMTLVVSKNGKPPVQIHETKYHVGLIYDEELLRSINNVYR